jgi:serine/threonine protein kinase
MEIQNRYRIGEYFSQSYSSFQHSSFKICHGFDTKQNQEVLIKSYDLPTNENAKLLALRLWEREIRLTRSALRSKGNNSFLRLIEASVDKLNNKLLFITESHGQSLSQWNDEQQTPNFFHDKSVKNRTFIWTLFKHLVAGLTILHESKLIHRNINPDTIYYSEESLETENMLKLGDFTWSLYMNNLFQMKQTNSFNVRNFTIFQAPEVFSSNKKSEFFNIFSEDIYSIGMVLAYILLDNFPKSPILSLDQLIRIRETIFENIESSNDLLQIEKELLLCCIAGNPLDRFNGSNYLLNSIKRILEEFENKEIVKINEIPKVNWYNNVDSYFLRDLSTKIIYPIQKILNDPNEWLQEEFKDSQVFITGIKDFPLAILTKNDNLFGTKPVYLKREDEYNYSIASLSSISVKNQKIIFLKIKDKKPDAVLPNGVAFTTRFFDKDFLSPWIKLFKLANKAIEQSISNFSTENQFIEGLKVIFEAERNIDSPKILKYKLIKPALRDLKSNLETAEILVSDDFSKEENSKKDHENILQQLFDYKTKNGGKIELSLQNTPIHTWNHYREWILKKFNERDLHCIIERPIKKIIKELDPEGVIRPFDMNLTQILFKRKENGLDDLKNNELILNSILYPRISSFSLGLDNNGSTELIQKILNTIPMFLVQGPPGTGKTWLASSVVARILEIDPYARILVSSKDHEPLDNLVEAVKVKISDIISPKPILVRLMSHEREMEYNSEDFVLSYSSYNITKNILSEANDFKNKKLSRNEFEIKKKWLSDLDSNLKNVSSGWTDLVERVANVVFATSTSSSINWLKRSAAPFDWVILEESGKSYPSEIILPMLLGQRWLLIGDQRQLPPFRYKELVNNVNELLDEELESSSGDEEVYLDFREKTLRNIKFFEDLFIRFQNVDVLYAGVAYHPCFQLQDQRRLPPKISNMISSIFYKTNFNCLQSSPPPNIPFVRPTFMKNEQLIWLDVPLADNGGKTAENSEQRSSEGSYYNKKEIELLISLLQKCSFKNQDINLDTLDLVILTPYNSQKDEIIKSIKKNQLGEFSSDYLQRRIHTVDSFQGRQADIVIISLVRNNRFSSPRSALGFLIEEERLNVMLSRVRQRMVIIGCSGLIERFKHETDDQVIVEVLNYIKEHGTFVDTDKVEEGLL